MNPKTVLTKIEEYLGFYDKDGFIWNLFDPLGIKIDSEQIITFPNGKRYRLDFLEEKDGRRKKGKT